MAAMTPLVSSAGPEFVASLRLLPAGITCSNYNIFVKKDLKIYRCDLKWFFLQLSTQLFPLFNLWH